jgi:hypothetical protein
MVPISRKKKAAGIVGAFVIGYALSWLSAPGPGERSIDASEPQISSPRALQRSANEPI